MSKQPLPQITYTCRFVDMSKMPKIPQMVADIDNTGTEFNISYSIVGMPMSDRISVITLKNNTIDIKSNNVTINGIDINKMHTRLQMLEYKRMMWYEKWLLKLWPKNFKKTKLQAYAKN